MYLTNKQALITGATSPIGQATAKLLAEHGANLILVDLDSQLIEQLEQEIQQKHTQIKVSSYICDVTNSNQVKTLFEQINQNGLVPTIIVNLTVIVKACSILNMKEEDWDQTVNTNLKATFLVTQQAAKLMVQHFEKTKFESSIQTYGSIINLSSQAAITGASNMSHYSATKGAINSFTKSLAKELGSYRIRVNSVMPYLVESSILKSLMPEELIEKQAQTVGLKRLAQPVEIAQTILYLASDSSSYVNGANMEINGGV